MSQIRLRCDMWPEPLSLELWGGKGIMIPFAKHNFMHRKYITAKIHNDNLYSTVAQTTTERNSRTLFVVASSG